MIMYVLSKLNGLTDKPKKKVDHGIHGLLCLVGCGRKINTTRFEPIRSGPDTEDAVDYFVSKDGPRKKNKRDFN